MQDSLEIAEVKIDWYREVLNSEPTSKIFLPFARLLAQKASPEALQEAISVLSIGLIGNPEFIEARLFYIKLLNQLERKSECGEQVAHLASMFKDYPDFWVAWGEQVAHMSLDFSVTLSFLGALMQNESLSFAQLLRAGLDSEKKLNPPAAVTHTLLPPVKTKIVTIQDNLPSEKCSLRTRSMAEVLAEQGDYAEALDIYQELLSTAQNDEVENIVSRIKYLQNKQDPTFSDERYPLHVDDMSENSSFSFSKDAKTETFDQNSNKTVETEGFEQKPSTPVKAENTTKKNVQDFLNNLATRLEIKAQLVRI